MKKEKKLSVIEAILINANIMIGAGIFIVPTVMTQKIGSLSFLGWMAVALVFLPVVLSITRISKYFTTSNSFYSYSSPLGQTATFVSGWTYFLGYLSIIPIQLIGFSEVLYTQFKLNLVRNYPLIFLGLIIIILALLNMLSLEKLSKIQNSLALFKLIPLIFVILIIFFYWNPNLQIDFSKISTIRYTLPMALFGYWGFESCSNLADKIKGGQKGVATAILTAFFGIAIVYSIFHFALLHIMGTENLANFGVPAFVYFLNIKSPILLNSLNAFISSIIAMCFISSSYGIFISNSNVLHSMAKEKLLLFSSKLIRTNKNNRPIVITVAKAIIIFLVLALLKDVIVLTSICNMGVITAFILTLISLTKMQIKNKDFLFLPITVLAFASSGVIIYYSWQNMGPNNIARLYNMIPLSVLVAIGLVMFKMQTKQTQKHIVAMTNMK